MKQSEKIWLIAAAGLVLAGALLFVSSMSEHHWDFASLSGGTYETRTVSVSGPFRNISIRSDTEDITLLPSGSGSCSVVFHEPAREKHTAETRDGVLSIEPAESGNWMDHVSFFSFGSASITVFLPETAYGRLLIEGHTGKVILPADFTFESIDISSGTGDVESLASASGPVRVSAGTGDIRMENISAGELDLSVSTGKIEVQSIACAGEMRVSVSTGKAQLSDVVCGSLASSGNTGNLTMEHVVASGMISVERTTGNVELEQCDAAELLIRTDTGDVTGSLLSEKVFIPKSSTGDIEVPETVTGGKCKITTNTGDIRIRVP